MDSELFNCRKLLKIDVENTSLQNWVSCANKEAFSVKLVLKVKKGMDADKNKSEVKF